MTERYCPARYARGDTKIRFQDDTNLSFYLPYRCWNVLEEDDTVRCKKCVIKLKTKKQGHRTYEHGNYDEPIPKLSHIYGGEWYEEKIKRFGPLSKEKEIVVMQALQNAMSPTPPTAAKKTKTKVAPAATTETVTGAPKVSKKKRQVIMPPGLEPLTASFQNLNVKEVPSSVEMIESEDTALQPEEIVTVKLVPFKHGSKSYWRDTVREKLYECMGAKAVGPYVGRWCSQNETILLGAPDSDSD